VTGWHVRPLHHGAIADYLLESINTGRLGQAGVLWKSATD